MTKKTLVSGIQSSGKLHIGNYFGAIRQNIELGNSGEYDPYIFLADYHSMTTLTNAEERRGNTLDAACTYLALGLDPEKTVFFKQSDVSNHTELAWILSTVTPMPMLMLAHAFKDSETKNKDINAGVFTYPVLMAADILMYNADIVPVGKDQEQHVEITRELAGKFNRTYGELFHMPAAYVRKEVATVPGTDGQKMSKSKNNHIPLFGDRDDIRKRIMSIVTDSAQPADKKDPEKNIIFQIHKLFLDTQKTQVLAEKFSNGGYGYREAKEELFATYLAWVAPFQEKYDELKRDPARVNQLLESGKMRATERANRMMNEVRRITGLIT